MLITQNLVWVLAPWRGDVIGICGLVCGLGFDRHAKYLLNITALVPKNLPSLIATSDQFQLHVVKSVRNINIGSQVK